MLWGFLIVGIILVALAAVMLWRQIDGAEFSFGRLILGVWLPGMIGGLMIITFWVMLIASAIRKV